MQYKLLILTIIVTNFCYAQDTELQQELHFLRLENFLNLELDIASTKAETSLQSPSTVTVIDRQMIEEYNFASISAAVETLSGIQVYRTAFKQQVATVRGVLQDHYANKVLVMINNIPSWHAITGEGNLDRLSIHDVERIEVLRGPASVIYGSQAYSGAINIILRKNTKELHTTIGTKDRRSIGANYRYNSADGLSIFTAVNKERGQRFNDNLTDEAGINGDIEDYHDSLNVTTALEYKDHALLLNAFRNDEGNYEGSTQKFSAGAGNNHDVDGILLGYTNSHNWTKIFYSKMQLFYDWNERNFSRSADDDVRANVLGQRIGGNISNILTWDDSLQFELGADYELRKSKEYKNIRQSFNTILAENNLSDRNVYEYSGYGQIDWKPLKKWRILIGSRLTKSETFGENISSRGTVVYSIDDKNTIKFIAGQSFRTPSLFELYFITPTKSVFGKENLEPETADTFEIGYQHSHSYFYIQTLAYYSIYKDKIHRIKDDVVLDDGAIASDVSVYTNGKEFTAKGLEFELKYLNPKFAEIFLNFDYVVGSDGDKMPGTDHYNFKYVPDFTTSIGIHKSFNGIDVSLLGNYTDSVDSRQVDDYFNLNVNLAYQHKYNSLQFKHVLSLQNLTDTQVTVPEYVRRKKINELPLVGSERSIFYSLIVNF
ncbi:TonB-dependent receptor [Candidatus Halobeggiatoa sp. HSG11]|nr:TonB-dependent receptor [Candidatus Halobeggiatoa sp. HSG11]